MPDDVSYTGEYRVRIDPRGRLRWPAAWRMAAADGDDSFLILPDPAGCLRVLPPAAVAKWDAWVAQQPLQNETAAMLAEVLALAAVVRCATDGRLTLPDPLLRHAGLETEAVLRGIGHQMQIWSPARHAAQCRPDSPARLEVK